MRHCGWGPGPNAVGGVFGFESPSRDADHDLVAALAHWVEDGVAPVSDHCKHYIRTTIRARESPRNVPWCVFIPASGHYGGKGDRSKASSYTCTTPKK